MNALMLLARDLSVQRFGWVLIHFFWEGAGIALVARAVLALLRNASAQIRYLILCGSFLACAIAPCVTWTIIGAGTRGAVVPIAGSPSAETVMPVVTATHPDRPAPVEHAAILPPGNLPHLAWSLERFTGAIRASLPYLVMLWGLGVMILSLRLIYGWTQLRALRASGTPVKDQEWMRRLHALAQRMGIQQAVQLLESARVEVPTVIGWLKPLLLLPVTFLAGLPPEQVEAILAHELAHIRRHDYVVNLVQILIETLLFYHPAVWWISRTIRQERENCCDDLALQIVGDRLTYATALAAIEESRSLPGAITMAASGGSLLNRIRRLMRPAERSSKIGGVLAVLGVVLLAVFTASIYRAHAKGEDAAPDPFGDIDFSKLSQDEFGRYVVAFRGEVWNDHLEKVAGYLRHGMPASSEPEILASAAESTNDPRMIRLLLAHGAKCYGEGNDPNSTVNYALKTGNKEVADLLISAGGAYNPVFYDAALGRIDSLKRRDAAQPLRPDEAKQALDYAVDAGQIETFNWLWSKLHPGPFSSSNNKELERYYDIAAAEGRLPLMLHLEKVGVNPASAGVKALENAVIGNRLPEARHLFDLGVTLPKNRDELRHPAGRGYVEMLKLLLDHGADINEKDFEGMTALCWAAYSRQDAACLLLIDRGIDVNITDKHGCNAAFYAAGGNLPNTLAALIKRGVQLKVRDKNGGIVTDAMNNFVIPRPGKVGFPGRVLWPAEQKQYDADIHRTISLLASAHFDFGASAPGHNALQRALGMANYAMAHALLDNGAPMAGDGRTALDELCNGGWDQPVPLDFLAELLKRGANPNVSAKAGASPSADGLPPPQPVLYAIFQKAALSYDEPAIESSARDALRILLAHGATFAGNPAGETRNALESAALGDLPRLQAAVAKGASVDAADSNGWTPLIVAMAMGNEDCVQWLLKRGAGVTRMTNLGDSPLLFAVMRQDANRVADIITKGADANSPGANGVSFTLGSLTAEGGSAPLGWAVVRNNLPIFRLLIAAGAKCSTGDVFPAIRAGDTEMVRTLLEKGVPPDEPDPFENRASAYWAVDYNRPEILKLLLDHGANPELKTDYNETPLSEAQQFHKDLVPILEEAIARRHQHQTQGSASPAQQASGATGSATLSPSAKTMQPKTVAIHFQNGDGSPLPDASVIVEGPGLSGRLSTGSNGVATITLPSTRLTYLSVRVHKDGFVPKIIEWTLEQPSFKLPEDFVLKTEKARTIGGVVRNEDGQPVAGARVVLIIRGSSMGGMPQQVFNDIWERRATTDKEGKWHFDEAPSDLSRLDVKLEHPDYISDQRIDPLPSDDEFRHRTAVFILHKGSPIEGRVTDGQDKPVQGVDVTYGEAASDSNTYPSTTTDANGDFHLGGVPPGGSSILTFVSPKYAPKLVEFDLGANPINVQLKPGKQLRVRFVDKEGHPIKGVTLAVDGWQGHRSLCLRFESDKDGLVTWDQAPDDDITFVAMSDSFQRWEIVLEPQNEVQTIHLRRPIFVAGHVIDAATQKPIPACSLIAGTYYPNHHPEWSNWDRATTMAIKGGAYQYSFSDPVRMGGGNNTASGVEGFHRIRIEALGFAPAISRPIANDEENVSIDFALKPALAIHGVVTSADGSPVKGARIIVDGPGNCIQIIDGVCGNTWDKQIVVTNDHGEYDLPAQEEDFAVAITEANAGYFTTTCHALTAFPNVKLLPWGAVTIKTKTTQDAVNHYFVSYIRDGNPRVDFTPYRPSSVENDAVTFKHLAAGRVSVGQNGQPIDEGKIVQVESGKTTRIGF